MAPPGLGGVGGLGPRCTLDLMGWSMYLGSPPVRGPSAEGGGGRLRGPGSRCVDLGSLVLGMSRGGRSLGMSRRGVAGLVGGTTGTTRGGRPLASARGGRSVLPRNFLDLCL